jgi:hypothetical protein
MRVIYSNDVVDGMGGVYIAPFRFDKPINGATEVYTDDSKIAKAYQDITVNPITKKVSRKK